MATEYINKGPIYLSQAQYDALTTKVLGQEYVITDFVAASSKDVASIYDTSKAYELGDIVYHDEQLYKCTTAVTAGSAWDAANWAAVTSLADELKNAVGHATTTAYGTIKLDTALIDTTSTAKTDGDVLMTGKAIEDSIVWKKVNGKDGAIQTYNATASEAGAIACGEGSEANSYGAIAIGGSYTWVNPDDATDTYTMAGATANEENSIAIGNEAVANDWASIAIGGMVSASGSGSLAIGNQAKTDGDDTIAIGESTANEEGATAINGKAEGEYATAINGIAEGEYATAINGSAEGEYATAINSWHVHENYAIGIGTNNANGQGSIAIGGSHAQLTYSDGSLLTYYDTRAFGTYAIAIGQAQAEKDTSIAINGLATESGAIAIGGFAKANGIAAISIGCGTVAKENDAIAIGNASTGNTESSIAIGNASYSNGLRAITIGFSNDANGDYSTAIGEDLRTKNNKEFASGYVNKSISGATDADKTIGTLGDGDILSDNSRRESNAVQVMKNGDVYIKGIGGFDGTNSHDASNVKNPNVFSVQEVINKMAQIIENITTILP